MRRNIRMGNGLGIQVGNHLHAMKNWVENMFSIIIIPIPSIKLKLDIIPHSIN